MRSNSKKQWISQLVLYLVVVLLLTACWSSEQAEDGETSDEIVTTSHEDKTHDQATEDEITTGTPQVGGTFVRALVQEPETLDAHKAVSLEAFEVLRYVGASLVVWAPSGEIVSYLAESWHVSDDGLVYTFELRDGITFHNDVPFTAQDYVYTIKRAINPETASPVAGNMFGPVGEVVALDDLTLRITLTEPFFPLLTTIAMNNEFLQPLSQQTVEEAGEEYGFEPIGVGPYRFKEWLTGEKVILERNPDFAWGPDFFVEGAPFIEMLEFRVLPEDAVRVAAAEAGELHLTDIPFRDLELIRETGSHDIIEIPYLGADPIIFINGDVFPLNNVKVRQALNMAINKEVIIQVVGEGDSTPQPGPLSPLVSGYWPGIEQVGYTYDVEQAKTLIKEAGYTLNSDAIYEKDGKPFKLSILTTPSLGYDVVATVATDMFAQIGLQVEIEELEMGTLIERMIGLDYELAVFGYQYPEADVMHFIYHTEGSFPVVAANDPELDQILSNTRTTLNADKRQEWVNKAQQRIVEQAYIIPLYTKNTYYALDSQVKGVEAVSSGFIYLFNAYFSANK